jgi:hypothetical protein
MYIGKTDFRVVRGFAGLARGFAGPEVISPANPRKFEKLYRAHFLR